MYRSPYLFLALDLHTDLESDGAGNGGSVRPLLEVVPHVHLAGQGPHLDDRLPEKVVALPRQLLPQPRLQVVILVPDPDLDAVTRVVAFAETVVNTISIVFIDVKVILTMRISRSTPGSVPEEPSLYVSWSCRPGP